MTNAAVKALWHGIGRLCACAAMVIAAAPEAVETRAATKADPYGEAVLADNPVGFWRFNDPVASLKAIASAGAVNGRYHARPSVIRGVAGPARRFDGEASFVSIPNRQSWSQTATGSLTVEFWMRPDRLLFSREEGSGYVWILGKGATDQQEWGFRMYGSDNRESPPRENRIAFYAYSPAGGEGAGAYFQQPVTPGKWIYVVGELNRVGVSIYRNGIVEQEPPSNATLYASYHVEQEHGEAPVRVGTRDSKSFFSGAVDELAIYSHLLTPRQIRAHYRAGLAAMRS